jgi:DNA polymerase V
MRRLIRLLTASGEALSWDLNGDRATPIQPQHLPHNVISRGGSFGDPIGSDGWPRSRG